MIKLKIILSNIKIILISFLLLFCFQNSTLLSVWEDNDVVADIIEERSQPIVHRYKVPVPGGFHAQVRLLIPPGADLSGATKYPMLVYV